jgi:Arc/MetJ-type ribon-helix-helix transcriptional regulator
MTKQRLSATVDSDLIEAMEEAVSSGRAGSVSMWVNDALRQKLDQERRLAALAEFVESYETEHGEITAEDIRIAARRARANAVPVRGMGRGASAPRKKR